MNHIKQIFKMKSQRTDSKKQIYKSIAVSIALTLSLPLTACTLARPELQNIQEQSDMLCGILAVVGELEESLNVAAQAEGVCDPDGMFAFEGVEGSMLGIVEEVGEGEPTVHFVNDGPFTEVKAHTNVTDEGRENRISGALLAPPGLAEPVFLYPVYRRSDGSVYVVFDGGGFQTGGVHDEGEVYTQSFRTSTTREINGKRETETTEIEVSVKMSFPVERISLREYSGEHELLNVREIPRGTGEVTLQEGTAYVMVEEEKTDGGLQRSVYDLDGIREGEEIFHQADYPGENGLIEPESIQLHPAAETTGKDS